MSAGERYSSAIRQVGERMYLLDGSDIMPFYGSLQPVFSGLRENADTLGFDNPRRFDLYAAIDVVTDKIKAGDSILCRNDRYNVLRIEGFRASGETLYRRGLLQMERGEGDG